MRKLLIKKYVVNNCIEDESKGLFLSSTFDLDMNAPLLLSSVF